LSVLSVALRSPWIRTARTLRREIEPVRRSRTAGSQVGLAGAGLSVPRSSAVQMPLVDSWSVYWSNRFAGS
jgi:hypothetical protein